MWDGERALGDVLQEHQLDETEWRQHERTQAKAIAKDASTGDGTLGKRVRAAILEARQTLGAT